MVFNQNYIDINNPTYPSSTKITSHDLIASNFKNCIFDLFIKTTNIFYFI